jgi:hypothetical protein
MNEFVADLFRRILARVRQGSHLANGRAVISILPLRWSPTSEPLPWEPATIELTPVERQLIASLWRELHELRPEGVISESDVLTFALEELQLKLRSYDRHDLVRRLNFHLLSSRR